MADGSGKILRAIRLVRVAVEIARENPIGRQRCVTTAVQTEKINRSATLKQKTVWNDVVWRHSPRTRGKTGCRDEESMIQTVTG